MLSKTIDEQYYEKHPEKSAEHQEAHENSKNPDTTSDYCPISRKMLLIMDISLLPGKKTEQDEGIQFIESVGFKTKETYSENEWIALIFEKGV